MSKEDILQRIQNILAKTVANGATEEEEHSAILMAQRLAAKYQINLDELHEEEVKIVERYVSFDTKTVSAIQKLIATELQDHFGVRCILKHMGNGQSFLFTVGEAYKAQIFKEAVQYVYNSFKFHWTRYNKTLDVPTNIKNEIRGTYLKGFLAGYTNLLVEQENKYALVVVTSPEVEQYMNIHARGKSTFRVRDDGSAYNYLAGYKDGTSSFKKNVQLTNSAV